jgi:acyl-CoA synthetase (NDP forming)
MRQRCARPTPRWCQCAAYDASIALDGVLIEKMGKRGLEMIVGAKNDPEWGPVVLAGLAG